MVKNITLLCKVIDNFGDIGVVWRLARALKECAAAPLDLRIIIDDLSAFASVAPGVDTEKDDQQFSGCRILRWSPGSAALAGITSFFEENPPQVIIECFACGRPEWLETLLFDKGFPETVQIINLEYLTAEPYAEEFHKLMSLTRSARVKKVNFMPGFTPDTGGLILDGAFMKSLEESRRSPVPEKTDFLFFSYERDCAPIVDALSKYKKLGKVRLAPGKGEAPFMKAYEAFFAGAACRDSGCTFPVEKLPFLPQPEWDSLLCRSGFLFIRGEDSLSRACLAGKPFVWHAYPQSEDYQLVKVKALLECMQPYFPGELYSIVKNVWLWYNGAPAAELADSFNPEKFLLQMFDSIELLRPCFESFSAFLIKNGNLAVHLMTFISEIV